jgi:hypothetical protein
MEGTTVAGHTIDTETEARLRQLATDEGVDFAEAVEMVLHVGLEFCESHVIQRRDQLAEMADEIRDIKACLHLAGRAALASNLLLAHWASKSGGVRVSEEELTRELDAVGRSRWADQLAQLGIPSPADGLE